jgi:hypothetical protein
LTGSEDGGAAYFEDVPLPEQLFPRPARQQAELGTDAADCEISRTVSINLTRTTRRRESLLSPVLRHTTVGVPEKLISLFSSTRVRWKVRSTNVSSSSVSGIWRAMSEGRKVARARMMRRISFFSNLARSGQRSAKIKNRTCRQSLGAYLSLRCLTR